MNAAILAQVEAMPLPEPDRDYEEPGSNRLACCWSYEAVRAARLEVAQMVLAAVQAQGEPVAFAVHSKLDTDLSGAALWHSKPDAEDSEGWPPDTVITPLYAAPVSPVNAEMLAALREIAGMTYDSWTNGARAGEIARAAIASAEAASKGAT